MINAGDLIHSVTVERPSTLTSATGGTRARYEKHSQRRALVEPLSGNELLNARQVSSEVSHQVKMRWFEGLKTGWRLIFRGRVLNVTAAIDVEERKVEYRVLCTEAV